MAIEAKTSGADSKAIKETLLDDSWSSLVSWEDVPKWLQDNAHIHSSYRKASNSYKRSFASIFHLHNETVNIWTHLVPGLISLPSGWALYSILKPRYDRATTADVVAMGCFFTGAALCLGMSATYHTVSNHSPKVAKFWNQLDYAGIAMLITGSFVPSVYYGFFCDAFKQRLYWTMVSCWGRSQVDIRY
jgi:adiponectin receptor